MGTYNLYKKIKETEFLSLKEKLNSIEVNIKNKFKEDSKISYPKAAKTVDALVININVDLPNKLMGNISFFMNESETGFDVAYLVVKDQNGVRYHLKKVGAQNISIDELVCEYLNYIEDGLFWMRGLDGGKVKWKS